MITDPPAHNGTYGRLITASRIAHVPVMGDCGLGFFGKGSSRFVVILDSIETEWSDDTDGTWLVIPHRSRKEVPFPVHRSAFADGEDTVEIFPQFH